jgi:hypothetical protein
MAGYVPAAEFDQQEAALQAEIIDAHVNHGAGSLEHENAKDAYFAYVSEHEPAPEAG